MLIGPPNIYLAFHLLVPLCVFSASKEPHIISFPSGKLTVTSNRYSLHENLADFT